MAHKPTPPWLKITNTMPVVQWLTCPHVPGNPGPLRVIMLTKKCMAQDEPLQQEKKAAQLTLQKQQVSIQHCAHVLNVLNDRPQLWPKPEFKSIRESISFIRVNVDLFPSILGDNIPDACGPEVLAEPPWVNAPALTKTCVCCLANNRSVNKVASPIFQVVSLQKKVEVLVAHQIAGKNSIHFTHLCLLDRSGDVMVGRLNINLAHDGSKLRVGEMVQLHLFTLLTYVTSSSVKHGDWPCAPMVVIHTFSRIGYAPLPQNVGNLMTCV